MNPYSHCVDLCLCLITVFTYYKAMCPDDGFRWAGLSISTLVVLFNSNGSVIRKASVLHGIWFRFLLVLFLRFSHLLCNAICMYMPEYCLKLFSLNHISALYFYWQHNQKLRIKVHVFCVSSGCEFLALSFKPNEIYMHALLVDTR